jgi:hypothetical protein
MSVAPIVRSTVIHLREDPRVSVSKNIFVTMGLLLFVVVAGGAWWWSKNGDTLLAELRQQGNEASAAGEKWGQSTSPIGCIQSAVENGQLCSSANAFCEVQARSFLNGCLSTAQNLPKFCATLPPYEDRVKRLGWAIEFCANDGEANERCTRIANEATVFCAKRNTNSSTN